ncbi:polh/gran [Tomelloso virus]|uniref:Polh/gran n=1 Tax=Tomelloso virus TaxID=2053981 RepID=A0A2H4T2P1_9VIRU|nr:polh/gran [Tomelloso virus]ATY70194.1 polh/gran [Tomelloso virus]
MGIKNGAPNIIANIRCGLYNTGAQKYKINVDGELMRYKGMIELNLCKNNAEEAIAATSFDYMKKLIDNIELLRGYRACEVIVFMDGARVANKESNRADFKYDVGLIRLTFKLICSEYGYTVNELQHGESELQMYLQRDKSVELNVFLTNDSDMISICYGHTPTIKFQDSLDENLKSIIEAQNFDSITTSIEDRNYTYDLSKVESLLDSCVWINCGKKQVTAIGFDFIETRLYYSVSAFRTFIAFCGTDFTSCLLTDSMVSTVLLSEKQDIEFINTLKSAHEIAACLLVLGLRGNGTIKRFSEESKTQTFAMDEISKTIKMYLNYIGTGKMLNCTIARPCMSLACRHYLYAMRDKSTCFVKNAMVKWAKSTTLSEAIEQLRQNLGTYNPVDSPTKATAPSRKRENAPCVDSPTKKIAPARKRRKIEIVPAIETSPLMLSLDYNYGNSILDSL